MFKTTEENWNKIFPKIEKFYKDYDKKFSKFDGELTRLSTYSMEDGEEEFMFPKLRFRPFNISSFVSSIECDYDTNEAKYHISLPNHIESDEDFDDVVNGLEKITSCKLFYENFIDEIKELF